MMLVLTAAEISRFGERLDQAYPGVHLYENRPVGEGARFVRVLGCPDLPAMRMQDLALAWPAGPFIFEAADEAELAWWRVHFLTIPSRLAGAGAWGSVLGGMSEADQSASFSDLMAFGFSVSRVNDDGSAVRIDPEEVRQT